MLDAAATFRSLRIRNYPIFMLGQLVSVSGNWLSVAQLWLVLHLTGSALALGLVTALRFAPILLVTSFGGVVADRVDKRWMLTVTLSALTLSSTIRIWMVYLIAFGFGCVNVFDGPGRQSFLYEVVGPRQISKCGCAEPRHLHARASDRTGPGRHRDRLGRERAGASWSTGSPTYRSSWACRSCRRPS